MLADFNSALDTVKKVLALDFACEARHFDEEGVFICQAKEIPGRRRFPFREKYLAVATIGRGVVICCSAGRLRWAKANLSGLSRDEVFAVSAIARMEKYVSRDGQVIVGPDLKYVCIADSFHPFTIEKDVEIVLVEDTKQLELYNDKRFLNSFGYSNNPRRVAAIARCNGEIAGVAGASADCDVMWQIGVDILPEFRNRGIGKAMVSTVTEYILNRGIVPYYSTNVSNIASRKIVASLGYRPAWVELYSRDIQRDTPHPEDPSSHGEI